MISLSKAWRYGNFFLFLFLFFFSNDFCEWGDGIGVHCRTERECLDCVLIWQVFCSPEHSLPSPALLSLFSVLAFFIFLQLSPFTIQLIISNLWHSVSFSYFFDFCSPCSYLVHTTRPLFMIIHLCPFEFPISQ